MQISLGLIGLRYINLVSLITVLVLSLINVVVQLLSHRVVERESLVSTQDVANESETEGQVATESLESVAYGLTSRADRLGP